MLKILVIPKVNINENFRDAFINQIAPIKGWLSLSESFLLYSCAVAIKGDEKVIEIGSYEGRSTVSICKGLESIQKNTPERVYSVDPHTGDITEVQNGQQIDTWGNFNQNLNKYGYESIVKSFRMTSDEAHRMIHTNKIGFLFIDGWHSYGAVTSDIFNYLPKMSSNAIVVFDDWRQPEILKAIVENINELPKLIGFVGKALVFSNSSKFNKSKIGRTLNRQLRVISRLHFIFNDKELRQILIALNLK